ncbi:hypothetical protein, partial [Chryseobacterium taklimakanense]|uniref:hypothetical protein n=1 Tax=Chryseobacterium taklimakanense TaxID=536441 RepID=UPI0023F6FF67
ASFCDEQGEEQKIQRTAGRKEMRKGFPKCSQKKKLITYIADIAILKSNFLWQVFLSYHLLFYLQKQR